MPNKPINIDTILLHLALLRARQVYMWTNAENHGNPVKKQNNGSYQMVGVQYSLIFHKTGFKMNMSTL
jgi:hypothetical protein